MSEILESTVDGVSLSVFECGVLLHCVAQAECCGTTWFLVLSFHSDNSFICLFFVSSSNIPASLEHFEDFSV